MHDDLCMCSDCMSMNTSGRDDSPPTENVMWSAALGPPAIEHVPDGMERAMVESKPELGGQTSLQRRLGKKRKAARLDEEIEERRRVIDARIAAILAARPDLK
jgi:hypothetical protein